MEKTMKKEEDYVFNYKDIFRLENSYSTCRFQIANILDSGDSEKYMDLDEVKFISDKYIKIDPSDDHDTIIKKLAIRKMLYVDTFVNCAPYVGPFYRSHKGSVPELPLLALATSVVFIRQYELERDMNNNNIDLMAAAALNIEEQNLDRTQFIEIEELRAPFNFALHILEEKWKKEYLDK